MVNVHYTLKTNLQVFPIPFSFNFPTAKHLPGTDCTLFIMFIVATETPYIKCQLSFNHLFALTVCFCFSA